MTEKSKLKQSIAMLVVVTLLTTGVTSYAAMTRQKELTVLKDNEVHEVSTRANTVGELLDELGYIASDRTILNMPADAEITDYMEIVVTTKTPLNCICVAFPRKSTPRQTRSASSWMNRASQPEKTTSFIPICRPL